MPLIHKKDWGPGYRWFHCEACDNLWDEKSRDCQSQSISSCVKCSEEVSPYGWEKHYEWPTDRNGNLTHE